MSWNKVFTRTEPGSPTYCTWPLPVPLSCLGACSSRGDRLPLPQMPLQGACRQLVADNLRWDLPLMRSPECVTLWACRWGGQRLGLSGSRPGFSSFAAPTSQPKEGKCRSHQHPSLLGTD